MKFLLSLALIALSPDAQAAACLQPGSEVELSGTAGTFTFHHAGNGQEIKASVLRLERKLCVVDFEGNKMIDTLQLLPEDYEHFREFRDGAPLTIRGKIGLPGDTAWYTNYHLLFYPVQ